MGFLEATYLILGFLLGVVGIALVRWLILRPAQRELTGSIIEELNCFNGQIHRLTERMGELTRSIQKGPKGALTGGHVEVAETLNEMNRLLKDINAFFAREETAALEGSDFLTPEEAERFRRMREISSDELKRANWDDIMEKLREDEKK